MIKKIVIKENVIVFNLNHERGYDNNKGIMEITYEDNTKSILDLDANADITNCDYLFIKETGNTNTEILFCNELLGDD